MAGTIPLVEVEWLMMHLSYIERFDPAMAAAVKARAAGIKDSVRRRNRRLILRGLFGRLPRRRKPRRRRRRGNLHG